jgi:aspartate ammonia-lyase
MASEAGQLQLNAFEPVIAWSLIKSITHLAAGCRTLTDHCVAGITANREVLAERVRTSVGLATALNPYIGYENASLIARLALESGRPVQDLVLERGLLDVATLNAVLRPEVLTRPQPRITVGGAPPPPAAPRPQG